jgi:hypothetical protein
MAAQVWNADSTPFIDWCPFDSTAITPSTINWHFAYIVPESKRILLLP